MSHKIDSAARQLTTRAFGEAATHMLRADGGPLCGQVAAGGKGWARTRYTKTAARVTCKKCSKAVLAVAAQQGGAA